MQRQTTRRTAAVSNDITGIAHASATVTVNGQSTYRRGEYYRKELAIANTNTAMFSNVTCVATLAGVTNSTTGKVFLARSPETFTHDSDGNLTQDGRWNYTWDGENRLVRMLSLTNTPTNSWYSLDLAYDALGRRISKVVSNWNGTAWVKKTDQRFVYDGWNLLAILDSQSSILASYGWGLDLSGSMQGAGGVGGLLAVNDSSNGVFFVAYDGNGNVAALVSSTNGTVSAQYEYGPFGEVLRATGPMAKANPFRFSTKFQDDEADHVYYGHRYYTPNAGKWSNRDPLGEVAGPHLTAFVKNKPVICVDTDGQRPVDVPATPARITGTTSEGASDSAGQAQDIVWGTSGQFTTHTNLQGEVLYDPPTWFFHPAGEGEPCCCEPPARHTMNRTDTYTPTSINMSVSLQITGCYRNLYLLWRTCLRTDGAAFYMPGYVNSLSARFTPGSGPYLTHAMLRYLSCEGEGHNKKWVLRGENIGRAYTKGSNGDWEAGPDMSQMIPQVPRPGGL